MQDLSLEKAITAHKAGDIDLAIKSYLNCLSIDPRNFDANLNLANLYKKKNQNRIALQHYLTAHDIKPDRIDVIYESGLIFSRLKDWASAIDKFNQVLNISPNHTEANHAMGVVYVATNSHVLAIQYYTRALIGNFIYPESLNNRGTSYIAIGEFSKAIEDFNHALMIRPNDADVFLNRGYAYKKQGKFQQAIDDYNSAIQLNQNFATAFNNRGSVFSDLKKFNEAINDYNHAIELNPKYFEAFNNLANAQKNLKMHNQALANYSKALELKPDYVEALVNLGNTFKALGRHSEAHSNYESALSIDPSYKFLLGTYLHSKMMTCDWRDYDVNIAKLRTSIQEGMPTSNPFAFTTLIDDPVLQHKCAEQFYFLNYKSALDYSFEKIKLSEHKKIKVGYFSSDFFGHATMHLMIELLENHNHDEFEIYGFCFSGTKNDEMAIRLKKSFDVFHDVSGLSDAQVVEIARALQIDIAIDLKGYTSSARPGIFSMRCAPIQINYLGYPGTLGSDTIDYIIADRVLIPFEQRSNFTESVIYCPGSYQVNDSNRAVSKHKYTKLEVGLPDDKFIYCSFNSSYKITPEVFDSWMRILHATENSVLWLLEDDPVACANLLGEANSRGISSDRIIFADRLSSDRHLARLMLADLFLDTWPCNAHTTASDALWMGLPLVTLLGKSFCARVAASLLSAVDMTELISTSTSEYEAMAIDLAKNPQKLLTLQQKLKINAQSSSLFDGKYFARHLEKTFKEVAIQKTRLSHTTQ